MNKKNNQIYYVQILRLSLKRKASCAPFGHKVDSNPTAVTNPTGPRSSKYSLAKMESFGINTRTSREMTW